VELHDWLTEGERATLGENHREYAKQDAHHAALFTLGEGGKTPGRVKKGGGQWKMKP
jgi:hypothetical protein